MSENVNKKWQSSSGMTTGPSRDRGPLQVPGPYPASLMWDPEHTRMHSGQQGSAQVV